MVRFQKKKNKLINGTMRFAPLLTLPFRMASFRDCGSFVQFAYNITTIDKALSCVDRREPMDESKTPLELIMILLKSFRLRITLRQSNVRFHRLLTHESWRARRIARQSLTIRYVSHSVDKEIGGIVRDSSCVN